MKNISEVSEREALKWVSDQEMPDVSATLKAVREVDEALVRGDREKAVKLIDEALAEPEGNKWSVSCNLDASQQKQLRVATGWTDVRQMRAVVVSIEEDLAMEEAEIKHDNGECDDDCPLCEDIQDALDDEELD